jgi:hypothetical protein
VDKWFYAGWAIRQNNLRLPAYRGGRSGTSVQRAALQKWDDAADSAGAAFPRAPVQWLISKPYPPVSVGGSWKTTSITLRVHLEKLAYLAELARVGQSDDHARMERMIQLVS